MKSYPFLLNRLGSRELAGTRCGAFEIAYFWLRALRKLGGSWGYIEMACRQEAEADAGWPGLVDFLTVAGLKDAQLERALSLLANAEVSNIGALRSGFSRLAPSCSRRARAS